MLRNFIKKNHILYIVGFSLIFTLFSATFVSALTYQQEIGVNFTFNPALNLTVSADLYINNLAPGAASDSNVIDVVVATNAINGYTLTANVGNNTTYNTRNLVHSNSNLSNTFTSIAYSATPTITTNTNLSADTWGFSYSTNNGSTWSNYNGLPLYSDTTNVATLKETTGPVSSASGDDVKFKIAAKASASQVSGAYNNVINFNLAANVVPQYTVQFNAGDGSGTMPTQTIFRDEATMLAPNSFTPPANKVFSGWNTAADGSGTSYTNQESVTNIAADGGTITLYAQWEAELYNLVAAMNKGTQTISDIRADIVLPTSTNPISSNSGVYEYDASVFGAASDASNDYSIYYYRGILDSFGHTGSYGSDGLSDAYPNYVRLANNTCWRIVRTTGSGGVKMIYNGVWNNGTCAKYISGAFAISSVYFNRGNQDNQTDYGTVGFITYMGYNYNSTYAYNNTSYTTAVANSTLFSNGTASNLKTQLEGWYTNNMTDYTSILEPSAGYCNDRTTYTSTEISSLTDSTIPYKQSSANVYFGPYVRNYTTNSQPSLNCSNATGYDLLTTSNGLNYPSAPLTADEAALAGSGRSNVTAYHMGSFLNSGGSFWLLSPYFRNSAGYVYMIVLDNAGLNNRGVGNTESVRPAISLKAGTTAVSGSGTATDPWVVKAPTTIEKAYERAGATKLNGYYQMQDMTPEICSSVEAVEHQTQVIDNRDNKVYWIAKLADGNCWMTQNLDHDIITTQNFYTYANTDIGHGSTPNTSATWTASTATYATGVTTWDNTSTGNTAPQSYNPGDECWSGTLQDSTLVACSQNGSHFHLGNFYNWTAAVAMNGSSGYTTNHQDVDQSICPAGWALPKDGSITTSGSFQHLVTQYGWDGGEYKMIGTYSMWDSPLYFPLSGDWHGSLNGVGNYGSYWSSVVSISTLAYDPNYDYVRRVYPSTDGGRLYGGSVRCVAR